MSFEGVVEVARRLREAGIVQPDEINDEDDLHGMLPQEIVAVVRHHREHAVDLERRLGALVERNRDAVDCLKRVLDAGQPFSLSQRDEVRLAIESLQEALAEAGEGSGG